MPLHINGILWKIQQIMQHILKMQYNSLSEYKKLISWGVFLFAFGNANV